MSKASKWAEALGETQEAHDRTLDERPGVIMGGGGIQIALQDSGMPRISAEGHTATGHQTIEIRPTVEALLNLAVWILDTFGEGNTRYEKILDALGDEDLPDVGAVGEP